MAIFSSIATAVGLGAFIKTAFGSALISLVSTVATNALVSLILGGNRRPDQQPFSISGSLQTGEGVPRQFPMGMSFTGGSLAYVNTVEADSGQVNGYLVQVIAVSDMPGVTLNRLLVNGEAVTLGATADADKGFPVEEYNKGGTDHLWIKWYDGTQTSADPWLVNTVSSTDRPYESTRVGIGMAYAVITTRINQELFTTFPDLGFVLNSIPLYDITKDSTAGGSGSQRWSDPSTWGGDGDHLPVVQAYNILRGITYGSAWLYGLQNMSAGRLPSVSWRTETEKCRAAVWTPDGDEPEFRSGGMLTVDSEIGSAIEAVMTAASGRISEVGGIYKPQVGDPGAPVMTIVDDEIDTSEQEVFSPLPGLANTINAIEAQYPEPEEGFALKAAPALIGGDDYEPEDGNRRLPRSITLSNVPYGFQVQRLMSYALLEARRARRHTILLPGRYTVLEPNDVVRWSPERYGYVDKDLRVESMMDMPDGRVMVDLLEVDPNAYDAPSVTSPVVTPVIITRPPADTVASFDIQPQAVLDDTNTPRRPGAYASWLASHVRDCESLLIQIRLRATSTVVMNVSVANPLAGEVWITEGLIAGQAYEARALGRANRAFDWTGWVEFVTDDIRLGVSDLVDELAAEIAEARDRHDDAIADATGAVGDLRDLVDDHVIALGDIIGGPAPDRTMAETVTDVQIGLDRAEASLTQTVAAQHDLLDAAIIDAGEGFEARQSSAFSRNVIQVEVDDTRAEVTETKELQATFQTALGDVQASVVTIEQAFANGDYALASSVQSLSATLGTVSATVDTIEAAYVDASGAIAAVTTQISASFASLTAMASQVLSTEADVDGIRASYVLSLNGSNVLEFVRVDDGTEPTSSAYIRSDYIFLDGQVSITDAFAENLVVNQGFVDDLTVGTLNLENGAVSEFGVAGSTVVTGGTGWTTVCSTTLTTSLSDDAIFGIAVVVLGSDAADYISSFRIQVRANAQVWADFSKADIIRNLQGGRRLVMPFSRMSVGFTNPTFEIRIGNDNGNGIESSNLSVITAKR